MSEETEDPLHLGNRIIIQSTKYGTVTGQIIFRDLNMVRVLSNEASDRAIEYPLITDGSKFVPELGVTDIYIEEASAHDHYVDILGAAAGNMLEFFTLTGDVAAENGVVAEVIKTATKDSILLEDGRLLKFRGKGPEYITDPATGDKTPVFVIRVNSALVQAQQEKEVQPEMPFEAPLDLGRLLSEVLPAAAVELVPTADRTYPDSVQREEMFQDLLADIPAKKRTNPRRIRFVEREVDLALALKNRTVLRDAAGKSLGPDLTSVTTLEDAIRVNKGGVAAAIPIVKGAKVLNIDSVPSTAPFKADDVAPRSLAQNESDSQMLADIYLNGAAPEFAMPQAVADRAQGIGFYSYIYDLAERDHRILSGQTGPGWQEDQDVIRTAGLGTPVQGLSTKLDEDTDVTPAFLMSDVADRSVRVLTGDVHEKAGKKSILAPSDPSIINGYVILPIKAALSLRPPKRPGDLPTAFLYSASLSDDNLPTIAQTLKDLYAEEADPLHAWTTAPGSRVDLAEWLQTILPYAVHPADSLGSRSRELLSLLDAVGADHVSPPVRAVILSWVAKSQRIWNELMEKKRAAVQALLDKEVDITFDNVSGAESTLFVPASEKRAEGLQALMDSFGERNPSIATSGSMLTASLLMEAQGDGLPLMWSYIQKTDDLSSSVDEVSAAASLTASQSSIQKRKALRDIDLLRLKAAPEILACPHVDRIEAVRNVSDVLNRSRLLRDFIETFQGPKSGDWMTCALCTTGCVCYHEIMELEALAQPSRMESIQKQILIRFGGERYQGKIVCRNCGQALQDIDYDEHVEFDDEGRAITGRSVLTEEQMAEVSEGISLATAAALTFGSQSQRDIYDALGIILERAGIRMPEERVRQVVRRTDLYVGARAPPEAAYEAQRAKAMTSAATKLKSGTAVADIPTYSALLDQLRVTALAGLVAFELQIAQPPLEVFNPFPICKFGRGGWPLEATAPAEILASLQKGGTAIHYISCVVASIQRETTPWRSLSWSGMPKLEARIVAALKATVNGLAIMITGDPKSGPLSFTPELRDALTAKQEDKVAAPQVSRGDVLTHGFRPQPFPQKMRRPAIEKDPLPNIMAAKKSGASMAAIRNDVNGALLQQAQAVITEMHEAATTGFGGVSVQTTDSVCCPTVLRDVQANALLLKGSVSLEEGSALLKGSGGNRLWPVNEGHVRGAIETSVDESVFFKLFLRFCYSGPHIGHPHEFSYGNICRQCGLRLGKSPDTVDVDKEGAAIIAAQEGPLKVEITEAAFEGLSTAARRTQRISATVIPAESTPLLEIADMAAARPEFAAFGAALRELLGMELPADKLDRAQAFSPLAMIHDELKTQIVDRVGPFVPKQPGKAGEARAKEATNAFRVFDTMTEDPFVEGPRILQEYWCAKPSAVGRGFGIIDVTGAKWFKISRDHNERINKLLRENTGWYAGDIPEQMKPVLMKVGNTLGPFMRLWVSRVRPNSWTVEEMQMVLQTIVFHVWRDAVTTTSWMYEGLPTAAERELVANSVSNWTRALQLHMKQQVFKYTKENIRQILQQRAELERTSVVKEFEDIKDDDLRAAELMKKNLRIGRWGVGKNLQKYDADLFEFESEQRARMGIADAPVDPLLLEGAAAPAAEDFGLGGGGGGEEGYAVEQDDAENA